MEICENIKIDELVTEWFYRLPGGYADKPYTDTELKVLEGILKEYNVNNWQTIISFLSEDDIQLDDDPEGQAEAPREPEESNEDFRNLLDSVQQFSDIINKRYITPGLEIQGVQELYNKLVALPDELKNHMRRLIGKKTNRDIYNGTFKMGQYEKLLYDLITETIVLPNIKPSVFWFTVILDGKVKPQPVDDTAPVGNINTDNSNIQLQSFNDKAVSFGVITPELASILTILVNLGEVIDGQKTEELTKANINDLLNKVSDPANQDELAQFLNLSNTTKLASLKSLSTNIKTALENHSIDTINVKFCTLLDQFISTVLTSIAYWATVRGDMVYITPGNSIFPSLNCTREYKLGGGIFKIENNILYVVGDAIDQKLW